MWTLLERCGFSPGFFSFVRHLRTSTQLPNLKMTRRDQHRRECVSKYEPERKRLKAILSFKVMPEEVKADARNLLNQQPRDACITRVRNRCTMTGRPRGVLTKYRMSRIVFRKHAESGKLAGVTRSTW
jgi:small subunit ribosomal protein S14